MPGRYTREGDVRELLRDADDFFVVSRPGDELALSFDATTLPPLPDGWTRTFLLHSIGYSKEMDRNSASPDQAWPLPFRTMTRYPYAAPEAYPDTPRHREYLARWNTRDRRSTRAADRARDADPVRTKSVSRLAELSSLPEPEPETCHVAPLFRRALSDRLRQPDRSGADAREHRSHAGDGRCGGRRQRAVPAGAAGRVSRVRARRAGVLRRVAELLAKLAVPIPNEHTDRLIAKAREHDIYIQSGSMIEADPRWPGVVFNTTCLIGPTGSLASTAR